MWQSTLSLTRGNNHLSEWRELLQGRNLIVTPHIAGATYNSMARTELFIVEKLKAAISWKTVS